MKDIGSRLKDFCLNLFIVYGFFSLIDTTTKILNGLLNVENSSFFAFIIIVFLFYKSFERFEKNEKIEMEKIKFIYSLNNLELVNIKSISISSDGKGIVVLKDNSIKTIPRDVVPKTQEELKILDKQLEQQLYKKFTNDDV